MGDIGGSAQAVASVADTAANITAQEGMQLQSEHFNAGQAAKQRDWSSSEASINRNFQDIEQSKAEQYNTNMSNTAEQRRMADLKKAGVNPLLAVTGLGGASAPQMSAPSGAMPSGSGASVGTPQVDASFFRNKANLQLTNAQTAKVNQETRKTGYEADILAVDSDTDSLFARQQALVTRYGMATDEANVLAQTRNLLLSQTSGQDYKNQNQLIQNNIDRMSEQAKQATLTEFINMQNAMFEQQKTEAGNIAAAQRGEASPFGKIATAIAYLQATSQHLNSAAQAGSTATNMLEKWMP